MRGPDAEPGAAADRAATAGGEWQAVAAARPLS